MSIAKATVLSLGFVGAVALGMWMRPYMFDDAARDSARSMPASAAQPKEVAAAPRPSAAKATVARAAAPAVPATEPALQKRLKDVLNQGTNLEVAAEGFRDGEQFAAVAHAARNTGAPFMVLKDRVVTKRMSLTAAIRDAKPDVNAAAEANRARRMARADVAAVSS
jgi:hypothetical protein